MQGHSEKEISAMSGAKISVPLTTIKVSDKFPWEVAFISYDGKYPNLCSGILQLKINNKVYTFPKYSLISGGTCGFTEDWNEDVTRGSWRIGKWAEGFPVDKRVEAERVVNANVPHGCCGGCI